MDLLIAALGVALVIAKELFIGLLVTGLLLVGLMWMVILGAGSALDRSTP